MADLVHLAGQWVYADGFLRQRCAWCGELLIDDDLSTNMKATQELREPCGFEPNSWISTSKTQDVIATMKSLGPSDGHYPDDSCMKEEIRRRRHPPLERVQ